MPFRDASFEFVVASEVLEHLGDDQRVIGIREAVRVLSHRGWFLGTVPYREDLLLNQVICPRCGEVFHRWGHRKSFDMNIVRSELSPLFNDVLVRKTAFVAFRGRTFFGMIKSFLRLILARYGAAIAAPSIYFAARK